MYTMRRMKNRSKGKVLLLSILIITLVATCVMLLAEFISNDSYIEDLVDTWVSDTNEDDANRLATVFPEVCLDVTNVVPPASSPDIWMIAATSRKKNSAGISM